MIVFVSEKKKDVGIVHLHLIMNSQYIKLPETEVIELVKYILLICDTFNRFTNTKP